MSASRYRSDVPILNGQIRRTAMAVKKIRLAIKQGALGTETIILKEGKRLDQIATRYYGDGRYWWVIAAASNIGWWPQVPPGTVIKIPTDLSSVLGYV